MTQKDIVQTDPNQKVNPENNPSLLRVLVLADADHVDDLPAIAFERVGCTPTYATTLAEARVQLDQTRPEIVFLPLTLAGKSTLAYLNHCKSSPSKPYMIVVASHDQINDAAEAMHVGAFDCLFKPFSTSRLAQTISSAVKACRPDTPHPQITPLPDPPAQETTHKSTQPVKGNTPESAPISGATPAPVVNLGNAAPLTFPQDAQTAINEDKCPSPAVNPPPQARLATSNAREKLIGNHVAFATSLRLLDSIAPSSAPVFLRGEIGTGKELFARAVHEVSGRDTDKFVVVDCAALRADTLASEMFGHLSGSIPNAPYDKLGMSHFANGGTLYFDELSNLDIRVQSQLVRFVQSGEILRVGEDAPTKVDIRLISSTSRDPLQLIDDGLLLKDLYYQLYVAPISLPPLRSRGGDLAHLAQKFLIDYATSEGREFSHIADDALSLLQAHHWPGNVHELKSTIWNAVLQHNSAVLTREMLPAMLRFPQQNTDAHQGDVTGNGTEHLIGRSLAEIEQIIIEETIRANGGSVPKAARTLKVSPSTLYRKRETWQG